MNGENTVAGQTSIPLINSPFIKKRIPRTTAKRKGLSVPHTHPRVATDLRENFEVTTDLYLSGETDGDDDLERGEDVVSEGDIVLSEVEGEGVGVNDGILDNVVVPEVNDQFDPYEGPVWEDDCDEIDGYMARLYRNGEVYKEDDFGKIVLKAWQLFTDKDHLREVVRDYCIQSGFSVLTEKANNSVYTIRCSDERCQWRLHASRLPDGVTWAIKTLSGSEHTCLGLETLNPMVTAKWAQRVLLEDIRANENIPAKSLNELLFKRFGVQMRKSNLYRMRSEALTEINGGHDISYSFLPNYCEVIKATNPTSIAQCVWNSSNHPERPLGFSKIFISFKACVDGLAAGCRGLIGIDGTFLKGNYGGVLLSAIALDGNNEIFPVAWGIVGAEDQDCWKFFIHHLKALLVNTERGDKWCIISDRHKAIEKACTDLWPTVDRRLCCKHLSVNFKAVFPSPKMWQLFWLAAGASSAFTFEKAMKQIQKCKPAARLWLANLGEQSRWSKHQFNPDIKCDMNKTNFVESFNSTLGVDRTRPVLTLLEGIRRLTMVRMCSRREACEKWDRTDICPNIVKRVQFLCTESRLCLAYQSGPGEFEIVDGKSTLPVSLNKHTCLCNAWQLSGIPCKHGMRAILYAGLDPHKFVHEWHSVKRYKMTYASGINPIPDREQWPPTDLPTIQPPVLRRGVGRPVKNRRRGEEEQRKGKRSTTLKCGICGEFGHNRLTCQRAPTKKQKKSKATSTTTA